MGRAILDEQDKQNRERLLALMESVHVRQQTNNLSDDQIMNIILEAQEAVRNERAEQEGRNSLSSFTALHNTI